MVETLAVHAALGVGPGGPSRGEHGGCAHDVGLEEGHRAGDASVDVALSREVHDRVDVLLLHQGRHAVRVADVHFDEPVIRCALDVLEVGEVAGVGQGVEVDDPHVRVAGDPTAHDMRSDEAGTAGDEKDLGGVQGVSHVRSSSS